MKQEILDSFVCCSHWPEPMKESGMQIYIFISILKKGSERIVIEPDKKITASEMSELWGSEYFYTGSSERENEHFYNGIFQFAPELNLKKYDNVRDALCHIYYASHSNAG